MNHEEWLAHADIYAVGALEGDELARFEAHLVVGCQVCESRLRDTRETLTALTQSLVLEVPPPAVKSRLLAEIARERPASDQTVERRPPRWVWWGGWTSAIALAGVLAAVSWSLSTTREELARLQARLAVLQDQMAEQQATLRFFSDPEVRYVSLTAPPARPGASGWLLWNPVTHTGLLLARGLPPPPSNREYELWALSGREPVAAGVFTVDQAGRALLRLPALSMGKAFDKFAVTLEPTGGVPQPTGPTHLLGQL